MADQNYGPYPAPNAYGEFNVQEYLRLMFQRIDEAVSTDPQKRTPAWASAEKNRIYMLASQTADVSLLPDWAGMRTFWVQNIRGFLTPDGKYFQTPGGSLYDKEGNPFSPESAAIYLNSLKDKGDELTEYQKYEIKNAAQRYGLDVQQFEYRQSQDALDRAESSSYRQQQLDLERQKLGMQARSMNADNSRAMQSKDFELWKANTLLGLDQPTDWIKRWEVMHLPNPAASNNGDWATGPIGVLAGKNWGLMTPLERKAVETMDSTINPRTADQLSYYGNERTEMTSPEVNSYLDQFTPAEQAQKWQAMGTPAPATMTPQEAQDFIADINAKAGILAQTQVVESPSRNPNAPSWLQQFAPSQQAGKPITKSAIVTPSAQQWNNTPWSVQQGLQGYVDWSGKQSYNDVLGQMQSMIPKTPRNAAYVSWQPRKQWA